MSGNVAPLRALAAEQPTRAAWQAVVAAAVRPEFRSLAVYGHPGDPVLFGPACPVAGCVHRQRGGHGLCAAHGPQYRKRAGGLDVAAWLELPPDEGGPRQLMTLRPLEPCAVAGCPRSVWNVGLCRSHHQRWRLAGHPDLAGYCASTPAAFSGSPAQPASSCTVAGCRFARLPRGALCDGHQLRLDVRRRRKGYTLKRYLDELVHPGRPRYDLAGVSSLVRSELQFGLQCMADERTTRLRVEVFNDAVERLRERGYQSLLDAVPEILGRVSTDTVPFLRLVCDRLERLADAHAGRQEWDRDVWRTDRLPGLTATARRGAATLSFTFCEATWLRALIKRWVRWRLGCGLGLSTIAWNLRGLRRFVEFCQTTGRPLGGPQEITRELLEDWLAHLLAAPVEVGTRNRWLGSLRVFLDDTRRHKWAPGLPASATYHPRELARQPHRQPPFLDERVISRLERDDALDLLPDLTTRTLLLILIETGLRAIDARTCRWTASRPIPPARRTCATSTTSSRASASCRSRRGSLSSCAASGRRWASASPAGRRVCCRASAATPMVATPTPTPRSSPGCAPGSPPWTCATLPAGRPRSRRTASGTRSRPG